MHSLNKVMRTATCEEERGKLARKMKRQSKEQGAGRRPDKGNNKYKGPEGRIPFLLQR